MARPNNASNRPFDIWCSSTTASHDNEDLWVLWRVQGFTLTDSLVGSLKCEVNAVPFLKLNANQCGVYRVKYSAPLMDRLIAAIKNGQLDVPADRYSLFPVTRQLLTR